jgi:membrane-associated protein
VTTDLALLPGWLDPQNMINAMGSWAVLGIMLVLFAECGLLIGFFLPGDTLLFIAGLLTATGAIDINLVLFIAVLALAAFIGNMVGYWIGYKAGPAVFKRPDAKLLKSEYIEKSQQFFDRYGKVTVVLARFVPVVRTVATVMAGAGRMNLRIYTLYSAIGGVLWVALVTTAGYYLGQIAFIRDHVDLIVIAAVVIVVAFSAVPAILHWQQRRRTKAAGRSTAAPAASESPAPSETATGDVREA